MVMFSRVRPWGPSIPTMRALNVYVPGANDA